MNCDAARRFLAEEQPDPPTGDVRRHLTACSSCRAWNRRLAVVEGQLSRLPVPPSSAKSVFVRRFLQTGGPVVQRIPLPWLTPPKERGLRKLSLAVAIAAVLAVFTLAWWSWPHVPQVAPHSTPSWVADLQKERAVIRGLAEPSDRVARADALATRLRKQARAMARDGDADGLASLAALYKELVAEDLREHARALSAAQRTAVLGGVRDELFSAESEFSGAAADASRRGAATAVPLRDLARTARDGGLDMQQLLPTT